MSVIVVAVENKNTCALAHSGKVYCWGGGVFGQLGNGLTPGTQTTPVQVLDGEAIGDDSDGVNLINMKRLSVGAVHNCSLSNNGKVYCWGAGGSGQLGDGTTTAIQSTPVLVEDGEAAGTSDSDGSDLFNIRAVASGEGHTCAIAKSGRTYCWGGGASGQRGDGTTTATQSTPVLVEDGEATGADSDGADLISLKSITTGDNHACAISNTGKTYCWGESDNGRLGNATTTPDQTTPVLVHKGASTEDQDLTLTGVGNFGGATAWEFYDTVFDGTTTTIGDGGLTLCGTLTINSGATLNAGSKTWTMTGTGLTFEDSGTFAGDTSTFVFTSTGTQNINSDGTFYNIQLTNNGTLTFEPAPVNVDVDGTLTITSGYFVAPNLLQLSGNFTNSGTFNANGGTVLFDNTGTSTITGTTTFFNLSNVTAGSTMEFGANETFIIGNSLTLTGADGNLITLDRSGGSGSDQFSFSVSSAQNVSYVNVSNSQVSGSADINASFSLDTANTDSAETTPQWVFLSAGPVRGAVMRVD